jgi:DNA-binding NarL/FixJ family response regulator
MTQPLGLYEWDARRVGVLLVSHERVIRAALRALIDGQPGMRVLGEVDDLESAISVILADQPDVTVLDSDHFAHSEVADLLYACAARTRTILLTGSPDPTPIAEALEKGAVGVVLKQQPPEILIKAIAKVHEGELWLDRTATARVIAGLSRAAGEHGYSAAGNPARLTQRERQVIALVGEGLRNSQIARRLSISEVTVRNHLTSIFRKLELGNRFQLVIYAFQHRLATLPSRGNTAARELDGQELEYRKKTS